MDVAQMKERISLRAYVERDLGQPHRRTSSYDLYLCPFHEDSKPSFVVKQEFWNCHGACGGGDLIHYVMRRGNLTFQQALQALEGEVILPAPSIERKAGKTINLGRVARACYQHFSRAMEYFSRRGISEVVARSHQLGVYTYRQKVRMSIGDVAFVIPRYTISKLVDGKVTAINMRLDGQTIRQSLTKLSPAIVEELRRLASTKNQTASDEDIIELIYGPKYWFYPGSNQKLPFNSQQLKSPLEYVIVSAENAEIDVMSLQTAGYPAVGVVPTWPGVSELLSKAGRVYIIQENDSRGEKAVEELQIVLRHPDIHIIRPPEGLKDANDVLLHGDIHEWLNLPKLGE